jgi:16S rRNA C1402 (ribose-2'-O) methylase RsmI
MKVPRRLARIITVASALARSPLTFYRFLARPGRERQARLAALSHEERDAVRLREMRKYPDLLAFAWPSYKRPARLPPKKPQKPL